MIWWPFLIFAFLVGFAAAIRCAGEEMQARQERINRLRALLVESERELFHARLMLDGRIQTEYDEAEEPIDRTDADWWRKA